MPHTNLRQFLHLLRQEGEVLDVHAEVDSTLEIAEIHRRIAAENGPVLFFHRVKGSPFPVVTNLFGSEKRMRLAFPDHPEKLIESMIQLATRDFPPSIKQLFQKRTLLKRMLRLGTKRVKRAPLLERCQKNPRLSELPLLKLWPEDGGNFVTLPLVYTEPPNEGPGNLGMYRVQRYSDNETGLHFQIAKGGGFHYHLAEQQNVPLPVSIFIGGPPALMLSAITPLPENVPELLLAALLQGEKLSCARSSHTPHPLFAECEFALIGEAAPHERRGEGPFGDHYGYYSLKHPFPIFKCKRVYHRRGAIYPATVVGKPKQEDFYIGNFLQKMLSPIFPIVMPGVKDLWSYGETGFHSLGAAVVQERFARECMSSAFRILGEGQLSLTKFLLLTDENLDLENFPKVLTHILERFRPETDLFIFSNLSLDTLDYTGPKLNKGSRGVMLGIGEKLRDLPQTFTGSLPAPIKRAQAFCPGCLVLEAPHFETFSDFESIFTHPDFANWPLLILVDDLKETLASTETFLWTTFTRFEPAADLHASFETHRHHFVYKGPILIDARMKPTYPDVVEADAMTKELVDRRWSDYFSH